MSRPVATGSPDSTGGLPYDRFLFEADARPEAEIGFREQGRWRAVTLGALRQRVERLAAALAGYGLGPGRKLAVLAASALEGWAAELSAMACGAVCVPLDPGCSRESLLHALGHSAAVVTLVSDQEALARVQGMRAELGELELVLVFGSGASEQAVPATTVETVSNWGAETLEQNPEVLTRARSKTSAESSVVALYVGASTLGRKLWAVPYRHGLAAGIAIVSTGLAWLRASVATDGWVASVGLDLGLLVAFAIAALALGWVKTDELTRLWHRVRGRFARRDGDA